jgi:hypothetical protein
VAKGHDFRRITLVAAVNPDAALFASDFRAAERQFALLLQAAGRAGRDAVVAGHSEMWVQTFNPLHPLYQALRRYDYRDLRESFFAARSFCSLDDLNAQLTAWIERVQRARLVPGDPDKRIVRDAIVEERPRLLPLPEHPAPTDLVRAVAAGKTPYVRFDRNDYSIPHTHVRRTLSVVASETIVRVLDGTDEIARHLRSYDAGQQLEDERHLAALTAEKRKGREHRGRNRLFAVCPAAKAFLGEVALHGGHLGGTTSRLLRLLDLYGAPALDAAIRDAHDRGAFRAESVAHVLDQRRRVSGIKPVVDISLPDDPRVRDLVVEPHRLDAYDNLGGDRKETGNE